MESSSKSSAHFDQYLAMLTDVCPQVHGLIAFDNELEIIWQDDAHHDDVKRVKPRVQVFRDQGIANGCDQAIVDLGQQNWIELINLKNQRDDTILTLCLLYSRAQKARPQPVAGQQNIKILSEFLGVDYLQNLTLISQENELNDMADELSQRYEELNLIYKAEDQALNINHGSELLRQLVTNTSRFLDVDVIYLYIGRKNIAIHKFKNDNLVFQSESLFHCLQESMLPLLEDQATGIVVNNSEDAIKLGIEQKLPFKYVASPVVNAESEVIGLLAIASQNFGADFSNSDRNLLDVMSKKASKIAQSHFDPLTGLENSTSFELILKNLLKNTGVGDVNHAIVDVDIGRMAVVNDVSGRDAGDVLIKRVGKRLASLVRSRDVVARIGSDKFGVLLENCDLQTAKTIMQKISQAVSSTAFEWEGNSHEVSVSIGIAPINARTQSVTSLLNAAETARNVSKERGRNNIHVIDLEGRNQLERQEQIRWVGRIQAALRDDKFLLFAQLIEPIKSSIDKPHYEILLRLKDDDGSILSPAKFLPAAESFYMMSSIDCWVINQSLSEIAQYKRRSGGQRCQISINLSGQSFSDPINFASYIENQLEHYQVDGSDICFEITETAAIANIDDARIFIKQLRKLGCKFSLDDFGTGLSSFAYLKNMQVDYLKIDGCFVRDIVKDPISESMVAAINQVGHAMQLQTIAEFVENDAIRQALVRIGVDYGQGYAICMPTLFADLLANPAKSA